MALSGIILGLINIAITIAILLLVGVIVVWLLGIVHIAVPDNVQKLYLVVVVLIALYLIVALLFGLPGFRIIG